MIEALAQRETLLARARALRQERRVPEALGVLARLQGAYPRFSRLYQERGLCLAQLGQTVPALEALERAVALNAMLPASWDLLARIHAQVGHQQPAAQAAHRRDSLVRLPREVVLANSLFADGDLPSAQAVAQAYLEKDPGNAGMLRLTARIAMEQGAFAEAEPRLEQALALAPDFDEARLDLALACLQQGKAAKAQEQACLLLERDPQNREYRKQFAAAALALGDYDAVIDIYADLLGEPGLARSEIADLRVWRANALKVTGRVQEAIADYRASLAARRSNGVAWFSLANLKTYRFGEAEIVELRSLLADGALCGMDRIYLSFALGKALEDCGDTAGAWQNYAAGNALRHQSVRYRSETARVCAERTKATFTSAFFAQRQGWGTSEAAPIFVLGLPRSGSTLIEQILASHSQVEGTQELTQIGALACELCGRDPDCGLPLDPAALASIDAVQAEALGRRYLAETRVYRREGRAFFIDKMPDNFWHIGLIHTILPNAAIIDVRRAPMACCFSNFKQLFGTTNQEFTYALDDLADHYRIYEDLMAHWDKVLKRRVLRVNYEDVVADLDGAVRRILEHCHLPFEPSCLSFYATRRSVRTPSSEQVRQPITRDGLDQWRRFEAWLEPLRARLDEPARLAREA